VAPHRQRHVTVETEPAGGATTDGGEQAKVEDADSEDAEDEGISLSAEKVLVAFGREPVADTVNPEVIAGEPATLDYQAIPAPVFTDPEIGTVGLTVEEAEDEGFEPMVGEFPFRASGRALTTGESDGFVRLVADEESGFVRGGQAVGPEASELIGEIGLAVELGATVEYVASTIHTHPTLSEAVMEAAENALGHAIHTLHR